MSGSNKEDGMFPPDQPVKLAKRPPLPHAGYGLVFSEALAQEISEFVGSPLFKKLKKIYGLQAKDRAARMAINNANTVEWLHYYRGVAAAGQMFFEDMEKTHEAFLAATTDPEDKDSKHKK